MNTSPTSISTESNANADIVSGRTEVEIKVKVVLVNGTVDMAASLDCYHQRLAKWVQDNEKAASHATNEKRIAELTAPEKIAETSAKVLSAFRSSSAPREFFLSQVLSSLSTADGVTGMHPDLYLRVRTEVEAWLRAEKESGRIIVAKGKSGGVKAVQTDLAHAAE